MGLSTQPEREPAEGKVWLQSPHPSARSPGCTLDFLCTFCFCNLTGYLTTHFPWLGQMCRVGRCVTIITGHMAAGTNGILAGLCSITWSEWSEGVAAYSQSFLHRCGCTGTTLGFSKSRCQMSLEALCQGCSSHVTLRGNVVNLQEEGTNGRY